MPAGTARARLAPQFPDTGGWMTQQANGDTLVGSRVGVERRARVGGYAICQTDEDRPSDISRRGRSRRQYARSGVGSKTRNHSESRNAKMRLSRMT